LKNFELKLKKFFGIIELGTWFLISFMCEIGTNFFFN
jgi:hypothetical protein